jgi:putative transposase
MTPLSERKHLISLVREAQRQGSRIAPACAIVGISVRTFERWHKKGVVVADARPSAVRPSPDNKLSEAERKNIMDVVNEERFKSKPPSQIVPILLDEGTYVASESSFYRVMADNNQKVHRGRARKRRKQSKPKAYLASGPNQVWSWDLTFLPTPTVGSFYYLYLFMDIYSRQVVGYEVHERECGELAQAVFSRAHLAAGQPDNVVLHSDNGSAMKSYTFKAKLKELTVTSSYSRPRVSNDNAYSESLFRTVKYIPSWPPKGFESLAQARDWVHDFVKWYNTEHRHSALNYVTPLQRHNGEDKEILAKRYAVLEAARARRPDRWSRSVRNCQPSRPTVLNPDIHVLDNGQSRNEKIAS